MSLSIGVWGIDENGNEYRLDLGIGKNLAGTYGTRHRLWGAPIMSHLGLEILPSLKSGDLVVNTSEALGRLKQEAKIIQENIAIIVKETNVTEQTVLGSTSNIIEAVELAEANNGLVTIS